MTHSSDELLRPWRDLMRSYGVAGEAADAAFADLARRHAEPGRFYHDLTHLREVLAVVEELAVVAADLNAVRLAAWFHDAVYDSRAKDNEERSADLARATTSGLGVPREIVANVVRLIVLTKTHAAPDADADASVLLDADLAILGAPEPRYDEYARAIRDEYAWVPEEAYREGRRRVLLGFLRRERIYRTERTFREREARARSNLRREAASLG